jgi:hypothetical protein
VVGVTRDPDDGRDAAPDGGTAGDADVGSGAGTGGATGSAAVDANDDDDDGDGRLSAAAARRYLAYGALVGLSLLAAVAVVGFYTSANAAINEWVVREFRPPFRALLNLAVLLFSLGGIYRLLDRLRD